MAEKSKIGWCDGTFNPWWGCSSVSEGCLHCYAETFANRCHPDKELWKPGSQRMLMKDSYWNQPIKWNNMAKKQGIRPFIFCGSMMDICDPKAPAGAVERLFDVIEETPNLFWILLTKRPERFVHSLPDEWYDGLFLDNVMLAVTAENQKRANERIPILLKTPCKFRMVSIEPMLGPIDFDEDKGEEINKVRLNCGEPNCNCELPKIDWVICGGESGVIRRPMKLEWARSVKDQCQYANVPFYMKQLGGHPRSKKDKLEDFPEDLRIREFPQTGIPRTIEEYEEIRRAVMIGNGENHSEFVQETFV